VPHATEVRLQVLLSKWQRFATLYQSARQVGDLENVAVALHVMRLLGREIKRLGGPPLALPEPEEPVDDGFLRS
jgi:hypothetical protein